MKAKPVKIIIGEGYAECEPSEATYLKLKLPSMSTPIFLPVMIGGTREGTNNWTWNGDIDKPTLKPSVLTRSNAFTCHSWITDGQAQFLNDCSHDLTGKTVDLEEVD